MLRRHPHPMTVHFPIAFLMAAPAFTALFLFTGEAALETTAFHCLGAGILFSAVGIATGLYTWWLNYLARPLRAVRIKIPLALAAFGTAGALFLWRLLRPEVLFMPGGSRLLFLLLLFSLVPMVTVIGWFGASMTFPVEKEG